MDAYTTHPPTPTRIHDLQRVEHTRLRRRMLYSSYEADLDAMLRQALGNVRASAWKPVDLTANPYLSLWQQVAVLYNEAPDVRVRPGDEGLLEAVADAALWPLMPKHRTGIPKALGAIVEQIVFNHGAHQCSSAFWP